MTTNFFSKKNRKITALKSLLILFCFSLVQACYGQTTDTTIIQNKNQLSNSIALNLGGTSGTVGIAYQRFLSDKVSLELGIGLLGIGLGMQLYTEWMYVPFYTGLKTSYNIQGSGGTRLINYIPFGLNNVTTKENRLFFGIDVGPAYILQLTPNGKIELADHTEYPKHSISIFGNLKIGLAF
jgi:hypothetical protein